MTPAGEGLAGRLSVSGSPFPAGKALVSDAWESAKREEAESSDVSGSSHFTAGPMAPGIPDKEDLFPIGPGASFAV